MPTQSDPRVAVYIDFDNIVISRYDQVHGKNAWRTDDARDARIGDGSEAGQKLASALVDVGAILDYASTFGVVALSRAYADWSVPANASYRTQLVDRAVDLTQLFQATKAGKNGGDIRLAVDVIDDLFRLADVTHVVIVAGDSDYISLAARCRRFGRTVVGIGVAGSTSPAFVKACDEFELYDQIPTAQDDEPAPPPTATIAAEIAEPAAESAPGAKLSDRAASQLLVRALELLHTKHDDDEWLHAAELKQQMKRLDPSFSEKQLGFKTLSEFLASRGNLVEVKVDGQSRLVRARPSKKAPSRRAPSAKKSAAS